MSYYDLLLDAFVAGIDGHCQRLSPHSRRFGTFIHSHQPSTGEESFPVLNQHHRFPVGRCHKVQ